MTTQRRNPKFKASERGMVMLETLPLLIIFMVLFGYALGSFGAIHTGILNSIAARNYAFEIFRHRTHLVYLRGNGTNPRAMWYTRQGNRIHAIMSERHDPDANPDAGRFPATERYIAMGLPTDPQNRGNMTEHNMNIPGILENDTSTPFQANPIWIKSQYGICLNVRCEQ